MSPGRRSSPETYEEAIFGVRAGGFGLVIGVARGGDDVVRLLAELCLA